METITATDQVKETAWAENPRRNRESKHVWIGESHYMLNITHEGDGVWDIQVYGPEGTISDFRMWGALSAADNDVAGARDEAEAALIDHVMF